MSKSTFEISLSEVPYKITAVPFLFNNETRYLISCNDGPDFIFAWDEQKKQFKALQDENIAIPDDLEKAIAAKMYIITPDDYWLNS